MIAPTHIIGGQLSYFIACWLSGHPPDLVETLVAGFAALLPDLDHPKAFIARVTPLPKQIRALFGKHRTVTHSLIAIVLVWLVTRLVPDGIGLAIFAGYLSHVFLDILTKSGVALFWPSRATIYFPGNIDYRITVMGRSELGFALLLLILWAPALWAAHHNAGFLGTVRDMIGDMQAARDHFDQHRHEAEWWLNVRGMHNLTYETIDGHYKIMGHYRADGLILETPEGPRSICRSNACDWFATHAVIQRGMPARTSSKYVRTRAIRAETLRDLLELYEQIGEVYLIGQLQAEGIRADPPTITVSESGVRLNFAQPSQIWHWSGRITEVSLRVQIRHEPGVRVPPLEVPPALEEPPDPTIGIHPLMLPYFPD
ncbi:Membrane-bound metal-dependent hydrolase YbcI, DUF457 family [Ectothiorhodosinus mongolicus]|uniref:Membrane-bound metal-dependent hydrolase YbcI, DUF457 family n=1 Tax=Ectothiorhodosinus mongolicus TaxID=233100 RepID=A0A1R3W3T1_9GAMM|nr:metal-dependent hydrolase [Ectothiorhodosinus mongolicus]ULX57474.1 metal-dependent hydrolase [Ectothiorhodosinus mongolicus]SIT72371.1 Membrane-bound metal-dependent hydrolase YbcI, DUF457 family [Ectothiorhodosinus mongolicus]